MKAPFVTAAATNPDAELLALCSAEDVRCKRFDAIHEQYADEMRLPDAERCEVDRIVREGWAAREAISNLPAQTLAGVRAKAVTVRGHWGPDIEPDQFVADSLVRDLLRLLPAEGTSPVLCPPGLTLTTIGQRIASLVAEEEHRPFETAPDHGVEKIALNDLGLTMRPETLSDAAVLCDLAFGTADGVLASEVDLQDALEAVERLRRVVVCVGRVVCTAAELDPDTVAWGDLGSPLAREIGGVSA